MKCSFYNTFYFYFLNHQTLKNCSIFRSVNLWRLPVKLKHMYMTWVKIESLILLTYLLTPWSRVHEKLTGLQLVKKFPEFYQARKFITTFASARHQSLSRASSFRSMLSHPTFWRSILILSSHLRLGFSSGLFPSVFHTETLYTPLPFPIRTTCRASPAHLGVGYRSLSSILCNFLHSLVTSSLLDTNILLNILF
jgi:hypothetical protein